MNKTYALELDQKAARPVRWWEIAILTVAVTVLSRLATGSPQKKNQEYYEEKTKQPAWAPPGWVFAPAWTINNIFVIKALLHLVKNGKGMPGRNKLLALQGLIWGVFMSFGFVYFRKRSNILGGIWTVADTVLSAMSFIIARRVDKGLANNYLPILAWTGFASTIAVPQALQNKDELLGTRAWLN